MKKKILFATGLIAAALTVTAANAASGALTLTNLESKAVNVTCNGKPGLPISANGGTLTLSYVLIYAMFGDQYTVNCTFSDGTNTGAATLQIQPGFANAQVSAYSPQSGVTISPASATTTPVPNITVALNQL